MYKLIAEILTDIKWLILGTTKDKRLLNVLLILFLSLGLILLEGAQSGCRVYSSGDVNIADCSLQDMVINVPNYLDPSIEVMNLSGNKLLNISDKSFERYRNNLIALDISNMTHNHPKENITYDDRSFLPLRKLEYLDISGSCLTRHKFRFPNNLKILKIQRCDVSYPNFSNIVKLEELHASDCNLNDFPLLHKQAPLKYLDLRRNNLVKFRVENIASFCELKQLRLEMKEGDGLQQTKSYCQCVAVDSWLTNSGIEHDRLNCTRKEKRLFKQTKRNLSASLDVYLLESRTSFGCPSSPSEIALQLRRDCLARLSSSSITSIKTNWWLITIIVLLLVCLLIPSFIYSRRTFADRRRRKKNDHEEDEDEDDEEYEEEEE